MKTQSLLKPLTRPLPLMLFTGLLLAMLPAEVKAQYTYTTNSGTITITGYTGPGGTVTIPDTITGLPVTRIGTGAFFGSSLTSVTIGNSVTNIEIDAFYGCNSLTTVTIPNGVTSIGDYAFPGCTNLTGVYFQGNAPSMGSGVFAGTDNVTVYYLPGTMGWGATFGGRPTALWVLPHPLILNFGPSFGVRTNAFGFMICWATNLPVVVEACTNLANPVWSPVRTNILSSGASYFSDPDWTNHSARFYRLRSS